MKHRTTLLLPLLALAAFAALATTGIPEVSGVSERDDDAIKSLMEADKAWSETVNDAAAFSAHLAPGVYFLPPDGPRVEGPVAFRFGIDQVLQLPGAKFTWSADVAEVSEDGDLGYTIGSFELTLDGPDGEPVSRVGKYVTIWKRQADGGWKVVADTFNFDAPISD